MFLWLKLPKTQALNSGHSRVQTLLDCPLALSSLLKGGVSGSDDDRQWLEVLPGHTTALVLVVGSRDQCVPQRPINLLSCFWDDQHKCIGNGQQRSRDALWTETHCQNNEAY